ncbi:unnamed protein product [Heligmosomoides polygyrus]|uniref:Uncharacterized protein n=1 Tax=Heligmosomoides polygyrus TaxID=6339 RepID=A0A183FZF6_HELPZ|nr:unnamed protein product [Heligmosomoides polygyrus]
MTVLSCLLEEFGLSDNLLVSTRQEEKMTSSFASMSRDAPYGNIEVEDEEDVNVESEEEDPTWPVKEGGDEYTSQQCGSFRFL